MTQKEACYNNNRIQVEAIYLNEAPMDGHKVCGFHMHALEWYHMQTLDVNQILMVAKDTSCDYFRLSVVRWLGDLAKATTIKNCNIDTNYRLGLKLFQKVHCFCGKDAALTRGPAIAPLNSSSQPTTTNCNRSNSDNSNTDENTRSKEYFIMRAENNSLILSFGAKTNTIFFLSLLWPERK